MNDADFVYWPNSPDGPVGEPDDIEVFLDRMQELTGETRRRLHAPAGHAVPPDADLVLVLEGIQDPGNVGTLLRSAAAAGAGHAVLSKDCAFAWSLKTIRAAMGAHFALNIVEGVDLVAFLAAFRGTTVALGGESKHSLYDVDLRGPVALLVGNEGAGLTPAVRAHATVTASIPMPGKMESLNAGVAGSLALFEAVRQRRSR